MEKEKNELEEEREYDFYEELLNQVLSPTVKLIDCLKCLKLEDSNKDFKNEVDLCIKNIIRVKLDKGFMVSDWSKLSGSKWSGDKKEEEHAFKWISQYSNATEQRRGSADILKHNKLSPKKGLLTGEAAPVPLVLKKTDSIQLDDIIELLSKNTELFDGILHPNFNIFELSKVIGRKQTLPALAYKVFHDLNLLTYVEEVTFINFMKEVQSGYLDNPYHNDIHACEVLLVLNIFLRTGKFIEILELDDLDVFSALLSAIIHDFRHPGLSNGYLQATNDAIAVIYNDKSVLENYHVAESFKLISSDPKYNILNGFNVEDRRLLRKRMIGLVLATDMSNHTEHVTGLKSFLQTNGIVDGANTSLLLDKESEIQLFHSKQTILNYILHAADISAAVRAKEVCQELSCRITQEFWNQGDKERQLQLEISYMCDRQTSDVPTSQIGFYAGLVLPFYDALAHISPHIRPLIHNIHLNIKHWKQIKQLIGTKMPDRLYQ